VLQSKNLYLFGYSGHSYVVLDCALENGFQPLGYFDFKENKQNPYKLKFLGNENDINLSNLIKSDFVFPAVGSNSIRKNLINLFDKENLTQLTIFSKTAYVSSMASVLSFTFIGPNAVVNSKAIIGKGSIINSGAVVEHECIVGNYSHVAPGAVLAGNVVLGAECFIGAKSVIKEGVQITDNVTIGAGTVVIKDILEQGTYVGNPARKINS
jgi:sugar O-acyltransferase (sialic acid O-acetyltransferase NeuD family)